MCECVSNVYGQDNENFSWKKMINRFYTNEIILKNQWWFSKCFDNHDNNDDDDDNDHEHTFSKKNVSIFCCLKTSTTKYWKWEIWFKIKHQKSKNTNRHTHWRPKKVK